MPRPAQRSPKCRPMILGLLFATALVLIILASAARAGQAAHPADAASPTARAPKIARSCDQQHPGECHRAITYLRREWTQARAAVDWQRATRLRDVKRANDQLLAPYAQAVAAARIAYTVCVAYLGRAQDCPPPTETLLVGRCESGLRKDAKNSHSSARGPHQYLDTTWDGAGFVAFPRTEYLPSFLAIELWGAHHHRTYSPWAASSGCHHLPL